LNGPPGNASFNGTTLFIAVPEDMVAQSGDQMMLTIYQSTTLANPVTWTELETQNIGFGIEGPIVTNIPALASNASFENFAASASYSFLFPTAPPPPPVVSGVALGPMINSNGINTPLAGTFALPWAHVKCNPRFGFRKCVTIKNRGKQGSFAKR